MTYHDSKLFIPITGGKSIGFLDNWRLIMYKRDMIDRMQIADVLRDGEPRTSADVAGIVGCSERQARAALGWLRLGKWVLAEPGPVVRDRRGRRYRHLMYIWAGRTNPIVSLPRDDRDRQAALDRMSFGIGGY